MAATETTNLHQFIAYFEEPEPGVPDGHTGWYHSNGKQPLQSAQDVFTWTEGTSTLLKPDIAGPFPAKSLAVADLQASLNENS